MQTEKLDEIQQKLPTLAAEIAQHIAEAVMTEIDAGWSANAPSEPGEAPAVVSGHLANSITIEQIGNSEVRVGSNASYAPFLEFGTTEIEMRPWLRPAVERVRGQLSQILREMVTWMR